MNWYQIFYWLTVADNARMFFGWGCAIFTIASILSGVAILVARTARDEDAAKAAVKWLQWSIPFTALFWALLVFTPTKRDSLFIIAGGGTLQFLTTDSSAQQIPAELSNFVLTELRSMSADAKVELGIVSKKEELMRELKGMTTEELLDKIGTDSTIRAIVLE